MTEINYRVIGFGTNAHGFFNQFAWCSTIGYAQGIFNAHNEDPEMQGAVVIKVQHEGVEVVYGPVGNHKVMQLVEVAG